MDRNKLNSIVKSKASLVVELYEVTEVIFYDFCRIIEGFTAFKYNKKNFSTNLMGGTNL